MLLALSVAVLAVVLGLGLGLVPERARVVGPLRTLSFAAALTVVLTHLLPEALEGLGVLGLLVFALPLVLPLWRRGVRRLEHPDDSTHRHGALKAGYVGLVVHHVGDGLGMGAYATLPGGARANADVLIALAAHTVPLVAVVAFAFRGAYGKRAAVLASLGLALSSSAGVVLAALVSHERVESAEAWIAALVAGLLIHVVAHDLERDLPKRPMRRVLDAAAAAAGVAICLLGGEAGGEHGEPLFGAFAEAALRFGLPLLLAGIAVAVAQRALGASGRVLEVPFGQTLAFDGLVVAGLAGGLGFGAGYAASVAVLAALAAVASRSGSLFGVDKGARSGAMPAVEAALPWTLVATALFAVFSSSLSDRALAELSPVSSAALVLLVALPLRLAPAAAVIIALGLIRGGLDSGAALAFAVVAAAPGAEQLAPLGRTGVLAGLALSAVGALLCLAFGSSGAGVSEGLDVPEPVAVAALAVVALFALRTAFQRGVRGFLLGVFASHDSADTESRSAAVSGS